MDADEVGNNFPARRNGTQCSSEFFHFLSYLRSSVFICGCSAFMGNSIVNRLPLPTSLCTHTRPPCASAICLTMLKPMPTPGVSRRSRSEEHTSELQSLRHL